MQHARYISCFIVVASFALGACSSDEGRPTTGPGSGTGTGGGKGSGGTSTPAPTGDTSATDPAPDAGVTSSSAKLKNAEGPCAEGSECESGVCFVGGSQSYCSVRCTVDTAVTTCAAPFTGSCNKQGYCKRD